jgi:hypothetical protein
MGKDVPEGIWKEGIIKYINNFLKEFPLEGALGKHENCIGENFMVTQNKSDILNKLCFADPKSCQVILHHVTVLSIGFSVNASYFFTFVF